MANNRKRCRTEPLMPPDNPIIVQCSHCGKSERLKRMQALPLPKERLALAYLDEPEAVAQMQAGNALLIALPPGWQFRCDPNTKCVEFCCSTRCQMALEMRPN